MVGSRPSSGPYGRSGFTSDSDSLTATACGYVTTNQGAPSGRSVSSLLLAAKALRSGPWSATPHGVGDPAVRPAAFSVGRRGGRLRALRGCGRVQAVPSPHLRAGRAVSVALTPRRPSPHRPQRPPQAPTGDTGNAPAPAPTPASQGRSLRLRSLEDDPARNRQDGTAMPAGLPERPVAPSHVHPVLPVPKLPRNPPHAGFPSTSRTE